MAKGTKMADAAEESKRQIAVHALLAADGEVTENYEDAFGIRYTDKASGLTFDYQIVPGSHTQRMLALFGARTLATNEASAVRQKDGKEGTGQDQIDAIRDRFSWMDTQNSWVDRTRDGGPRWDLPTLASAAVNVMVGAGKIADTDEAKGAAMAKYLELMTQDPAKVTAIKDVAGVQDEYKKLKGKTAKPVDDLAAMLA